jgi:tetratricopeptide (TPR) repeat protein
MSTACEDTYAAIQMMITEARHEDAMVALEQWLAENSDHALAHKDLGDLYFLEGKTDQALAHYEKAAELNPENTDYLKNLADILYSQSDDVERALAIYDKILSIRSDDIDTLMVAGHIRVSLEHFDEAMRNYTRILEIDPSNEDAKHFADRINCHKEVQEASESSPEAVCQHCQALVAQGQLNEGIACLERLIQQHPDFALAHNDLGVLYYQRGDKARCVKNYKKATEMDPQNSIFRKNLADFYLIEEGAVEKAMEIYVSVLKDDPEDIDSLMAVGHICTSLKEKDSARTFYERILDIEPWNFDASERIEQLNSD